MQETEKYKLKKPDAEDFFSITDFNENADKIEQALGENAEEVEGLKAPYFDDSGTVEGISSFTDFMEKVKSKMNIFQFFRNFKAGMKYVLHTGKLVNNATTTQEGFALDARMGKTLQDQINDVNKNITMKAMGEFKKFDVFQEGWYRFAKFQCGTSLSLVKGASGNSVVFSIKFAFNNSNNMSALGVLNSSYQMSNINILGSSISSQTISKLRHVIDESNNNAYLEFYYNSGVSNAVAIELINTLDTNIKWTIMDKLEPTQEAVENVVVYSTADLVTKNRNVVINSDLKPQIKSYSTNYGLNVRKIKTLTNLNIEISGRPNTSINSEWVALCNVEETTLSTINYVFFTADNGVRYLCYVDNKGDLYFKPSSNILATDFIYCTMTYII